ncbi:MAG: Mrp/NBP35 family ATP-binding protein [Planctomycetota bacterium]
MSEQKSPQGLTKDAVRDAINAAPLSTGGTFGDLQAVEWVASCDGHVAVKLHLPKQTDEAAFKSAADAAASAIAQRSQELQAVVSSLVLDFVDSSGTVVFTAKAGNVQETTPEAQTESRAAQPQAPDAGHRPIPNLKTPERAASPDTGLPGVTHIVAVGAGKGGVGKSSVAVNLAVGLARAGHAVGLLDGDIYGPSLPTMLNLNSLEQNAREGMLEPHFVHGVKAITLGKLVDPEKPLIWRGPMAHGAFKQLVDQTRWGELDYLIIDLPPGTGDVPLTMAQTLKLTGAVIVCTPQQVAQDDAVRAARMFQQLGIEILGVVENMSYFVGDDGKTYDIFGRGGAEQMAQRLNLPFLGSVPITTSLRANSDAGDPTANFEGTDDAGERLNTALTKLTGNLEKQVALASLQQGATKPSLSIS